MEKDLQQKLLTNKMAVRAETCYYTWSLNDLPLTPRQSTGCATRSAVTCTRRSKSVSTAEIISAQAARVTAVGFEPPPLRNGALSRRLRPLGLTVLTQVMRGSLFPA